MDLVILMSDLPSMSSDTDRSWQERGIWELMNMADPKMRDELLTAWRARDEAFADRDSLRVQLVAANEDADVKRSMIEACHRLHIAEMERADKAEAELVASNTERDGFARIAVAETARAGVAEAKLAQVRNLPVQRMMPGTRGFIWEADVLAAVDGSEQ